jgi:hypothetical protein
VTSLTLGQLVISPFPRDAKIELTANSGTSASSAGSFDVSVGHISPKPGVVMPEAKCLLNVYRVKYLSSANGQWLPPVETLVYTGEMERLVQAQVVPPAGQLPVVTFRTDFSVVRRNAKETLTIGAVYRAEAVFHRVFPGGKPLLGAEVAAADLIFNLSEAPKIPVATVAGAVEILVQTTPKAGSTINQKKALKTAQDARYQDANSRILGAMRQYGNVHGPTDPNKTKWEWRTYATGKPGEWVQGVGFSVIRGEVLSSSKNDINADFLKTARDLSKTHTLPGGTVRVTIKNTLSFTDKK